MAKQVEDLGAALARRRVTSDVLVEVRDERERQVGLGYDAAHDDEHGSALVAQRAFDLLADVTEFVTPKDTRKALVQVAALVVAAIETLDREAAAR